MNEESFIPLKIMNEEDKAELLSKLNEQFGIEDISGMILSRGKERIFLFSGDLVPEKLKDIEREIIVERAGVYFARFDEKTEKFRLSIEGSQLLKEQIKKNIYEIENDKDFESWMKGEDLQIKTGKREFLIMKYEGNFLGTGKASEYKISNFIPKNRRLKNKN